MTDTQWPRYEVFEKERPDGPHRHAGSVHAPDDEMAMELARDVFVRRPTCLSLWIVPSAVILKRTAEELAAGASGPAWSAEQASSSPQGGLASPTTSAGHQALPTDEVAFLVFQKKTQRAGETYVDHTGEVMARSADQALQRALTLPHFGANAFVWWIVPAAAVVASRPEEAPSLFDPALTKPYRSPQFYHVHTEMRQLKRAEDDPDA